nr:hypothetical protein GCM10020185_49850 [Pseudomonas brassicacearum subsp. brassicacearum]
MFAGATQAAAPLRPPQGYFAPIEKVKAGEAAQGCDATPTPYTGSLQFRSKYEGSDKARATLNVQSEKKPSATAPPTSPRSSVASASK